MRIHSTFRSWLAALAAAAALSTLAAATAPLIHAGGVADACESCLTDATYKPFLDQLKLVSVTFESGISAKKMAGAIKALKDAGFEPYGQPERGYSWAGEIDPIRASVLSKIDGVDSITRGSRDGVEVWKDGRKRNLKVPEDAEEGTDEELWSQLRHPIAGTPPRDLATIRKVAREKGVTIVLSDRRPADAQAIRDYEDLWGGRVFFAGDLTEGAGIVRIPGVVLHIEPDAKALSVRGDLSILLGRGRMLEHLNKVTEAEWVHGIDEDAMTPTSRGSELLKSKKPDPELAGKVEAYLRSGDAGQLKEIRQGEAAFLEGVVAKAKAKFPPGAFFKGKFDYATMESGGIINTMSMDPASMASAYVKALKDFAAETPKKGRTVDAFEYWLRDNGSAQAVMAHNLLDNPDDVLVQQRIDIAKTSDDNNMEFRVDVFEGHAVNASFRMGLEHHPEEEQAARAFVQKFFDHAPEKDRYFTGGLDVALAKDGSFKIIETNPGSESSFINSASYPVSGNTALSNLLGRPTTLIKMLEKAYREGPEASVKLLQGMRLRSPDEIQSIAQMNRFDTLLWFRDKYLAEWAKQPTPAKRREIMARMRKVARDSGAENEDFEYYVIDRMKDYMQQRKPAS